jgi:RimJ/RimL family protein N-acetyltransferase/predicted nucleotidyltransferase
MTNSLNTSSITPYQDVNDVLFKISNDMKDILDDNLIGLYLCGSLTYGDFNPDSSDIDLVAIINQPLSQHELERIKQLHEKIGNNYQKWADRLECSYTPAYMLKNILPPKEPRAYYGGGIFYEEAPYGNEWIINNYLLYEYGIPLIGPDFKTLTPPIDIVEVQKASIRDLFQEWEPKITDLEWLNNSHYQSYLIMNLCRILYTVMCGAAGTKKVSAEWVKNQFGPPWSNLIAVAENWEYGKKMALRNETIDFIKFTIDTIKHTSFYQQMICGEMISNENQFVLPRRGEENKTDFSKMILISTRLKLVPISMEYAHDIYKHFTAEIARFMWPSAPKSLDEIKQHIEIRRTRMINGEDISLMILSNESGEFLGYMTLDEIQFKTPELGIWLKKSAHGHGLGYEAINLLKSWAESSLEYDYFKYPVHKNNIPSRRLAEKIGGKIEDEYIKISESGNPLDEYEYRIYK